MTAVLALLAALALLFFSLVEMAFAMLMRLPERLEAERGNEGDALGQYLDDPLRFFVPARLMRGTLIVIVIILVGNLVDTSVAGDIVLFVVGLVLTIGVGQLLPAVLVRRQPEKVLELALPMFTWVANLISPVTVIVIAALGSLERDARSNGTEPRRSAAPASNPKPESEVADESRLLRSVVDFGDTLVREVMTPRPDIVAIPSTATIEELERLIREQEYSRLPVFAENLDNIVGLVVVKDLIQRPADLAAARAVSDIMRPASFVPETKRVMDLMREFQRKRFQLAIVVDEYGGTAGLVTVEDVVEELVGEIRDEYDSEADPIVKESDDTFVFSAKVGISDMADRLALEQNEFDDGAFETVGGYVMTRAGRVPAVGEKLRFDNLEVEILEAERRRIHKVRIHRLPQPEGAGG